MQVHPLNAQRCFGTTKASDTWASKETRGFEGVGFDLAMLSQGHALAWAHVNCKPSIHQRIPIENILSLTY